MHPKPRCKPLFAARQTWRPWFIPIGWRGYDGLVDLGYDKHRRVNHGDNQFALGPSHINGIESFWSYAKHRLAKFHGMRKSTFPLHLKETEFRFNQRNNDLYKLLLSILSKDPL